MNLKELKTVIDSSIEHLHFEKPENISVLITTSESSMGARASIGVEYVGLGFDWERGQFRIEPSKSLVSKGNSLTDVKDVVCRQYDGRNYYFCPRCQQKISKSDSYCRYCSQKLN